MWTLFEKRSLSQADFESIKNRISLSEKTKAIEQYCKLKSSWLKMKEPEKATKNPKQN
jgi:hypothetical protein